MKKLFSNSIVAKWVRNTLKGATYTSMLFIVQACYGTGPGSGTSYGSSYAIEGYVRAEGTGDPIKGIQVRSNYGGGRDAYTDAAGRFVLFVESGSSMELWFLDVDGEKNGSYESVKLDVVPSTGKIYEIFLKEK